MAEFAKSLDGKRPTWGEDLSEPRGYVAEFRRDGNFNHAFGGAAWQVNDVEGTHAPPSLLVTLDLADPDLESLSSSRLRTLPLCSHLNNYCWAGMQIFKIEPETNSVELIHAEWSKDEALLEPDRMPVILPEHQLTLRAMRDSEYLIDERRYDLAVDHLRRGDGFIRVLGSPLWINSFERIICQCGRELQYIASIGAESSKGRNVFKDTSFYFGEGTLYFFFCSQCLIVAVDSQGT